jgi:hypothetical protein
MEKTLESEVDSLRIKVIHDKYSFSISAFSSSDNKYLIACGVDVQAVHRLLSNATG